ncbi:PAS domain S-box protein [Pseudomonas lalucatii]|uniref:histidine kinase n=2 Tax=Pseudomonas lalucatii TaxID=1424203 RepID=A0ABS5PZJ6_9PSED|nr:PAS domain S-box protein [Pseudomonas lalucatii]
MLLLDSTLAALLLGVGMLAYANHRQSLLRITAGLLLAIGLYSLLVNALAPDSTQARSLISDAPPMRSSMALVFCLVAAGLLIARWHPLSRRLTCGLGVALIGLAGLSQLATDHPALSGWQLGTSYAAYDAANLLTLCCGLALVCMGVSAVKHITPFDRVTLAVGLLCAVMSAMGWYLLSLHNLQADVRRSEIMLDKLSSIIERTVQGHRQAMLRMAERWRANNELPSDSLWRKETHSFFRDLLGFELFALLDPTLQPKMLSSRSFADTDQAYQLLKQPQLRTWLQALDDHTRPHGITVSSQDIPPHRLSAIPLGLPNQPGWLLLASIDLSRLLGDALNDQLEGFRVRVFEDEQLLFDSDAQPPRTTPKSVSQMRIRGLRDSEWRLVSYVGNIGLEPSARRMPSLVLLFGLTLSFMLMLSQRLRLQTVLHSRQVQRSNQALEASLQRQASLQTLNQRIMLHSTDLLLTLNAHGRIIEINSACYPLLGYRPEELVGRILLDYVLAEDQAVTRSTLNATMSGEPPRDFQNRCRHKDGSIAHLLWSCGWAESEHSFVCAGHDITHLMLYEAYLEDQRDILGMISTNQPLNEILNAICQMAESRDPTGLCSILLADKAQQSLHLGAAPNLPQTYNQAIDGVAIGPSAGSCGTAVYRQQLVIVEDIAQDPLWQDYRTSALAHGLRACWSIPLRSNQGHALGSLAIYHREEMTPSDEQLQLLANAAQLASIAIEREQDRKHLQASEQRFRSLFSFSPNAVAALDLTGRFESLNHAAGELFGSGKELLGKQLSDCILDADLPQVRQRFAESCAGNAQRVEARCVGLCGNPRDLSLTFLPIRVDDAIVGVFAVAKDISARKQAQEQLQATLQELQRSNSELQEFAFVASHDLQEPLRKIQTFSERLGARAESLDPQSRDYLERMGAAANRMQVLIRDLLDYSRVSSRGKPFEMLDTEQILDGVLRDMETDLENSNAQVRREPLPPILGDPTQIRQLLQNLLSNAVKFHKDGQPPCIRIYSEQVKSGEWALCVEDQGIGFDEKYLDRIFNPFQRLHGRGVYPGTGIGLAIVKKIVERHHARISASSTPGQGSLFRVTFTLNKQE